MQSDEPTIIYPMRALQFEITELAFDYPLGAYGRRHNKKRRYIGQKIPKLVGLPPIDLHQATLEPCRRDNFSLVGNRRMSPFAIKSLL
ncbi:hypothetical protein QKT49_gp228 [Acanthamoeba castellanii medusavirus]|uniref:Uncharacterized protein n=1 Tax=Acanthamoeba castellanii medusavirus J1 TaxID=3114988 RepID=A0A3T1CXM4_9VIRU|nr:hypothetical protein QKT49_gp228 [Acanthamoeba castellanii medusavirus]BBI30535.1 hypothetical protein [Acanthamoeba castellanii medusavirus J1]